MGEKQEAKSDQKGQDPYLQQSGKIKGKSLKIKRETRLKFEDWDLHKYGND